MVKTINLENLYNNAMERMSLETYERQMAIVDAHKKLGEAEEEIAQGIQLLDGEEVFKRLNKKYIKKHL